MARFYFSRYHFTFPDNTSDLKKMEFLDKLVSGKSEIEYRKDLFRFVNTAIEKIGSKNYITGRLIKYKLKTEETVLNSQNKIDIVNLENRILGNVRFIIDPASSIIVFEESRSYIPKESFPLRFIELIQANFKGVEDFVISPITQAYAYRERINEISQIKRLKIVLVPSNPNNADLWRKTDERLRNDKISKYTEILENKKKNEGLVVDPETQAKLSMVEDGYGKSDATGVDKNGKTIFINSEKSKQQEHKDLPSDVVSMTNTIGGIQEKLKEIIKRTNEGNS
jgi:hypothetical protein